MRTMTTLFLCLLLALPVSSVGHFVSPISVAQADDTYCLTSRELENLLRLAIARYTHVEMP